MNRRPPAPAIRALTMALTLSAALGSSAAWAADGVRVTNFRQGLVKFDTDDRPFISDEGSDFIYKINGTCVAAGESYPCLWYGFEFEYESDSDTTQFECTSVSDIAQKHVYPGAVIAENTNVIRYGFVVSGRQGKYLRPQYTFGGRNQGLHSKDTCSVDGKEVMKWELRLHPASVMLRIP